MTEVKDDGRDATDGKIFTVEAVTNAQNDRLYARDAGDLPEGSRTHLRRMKPATVMEHAYIKMLTEKVLLWITEFWKLTSSLRTVLRPTHRI